MLDLVPLTSNQMLLERFIKFAGVANKSAETYLIALKQMLKFFQDNHIVNPTRTDLENWRDNLIDDRKSASTVQLYLTSAKLFFRWLAMENIFPNIADNLKNRVKISHEHKKDFLSRNQARQLLHFSKGDGTLKNIRDQAIIALMLTSGLRTIEICRADIGDIHTINESTFLYVQGKGRSEKSESVRIAPQVFLLIQHYLALRADIENDAPLFVAISNRCKNQRLDTQSIRKMIKSNLRGIGLDHDRLSAHSLRHTAATQMLFNGAKLEEVQQVLRHKQIGTTMIYNHSLRRFQNNSELIVADSIFSDSD